MVSLQSPRSVTSLTAGRLFKRYFGLELQLFGAQNWRQSSSSKLEAFLGRMFIRVPLGGQMGSRRACLWREDAP